MYEKKTYHATGSWLTGSYKHHSSLPAWFAEKSPLEKIYQQKVSTPLFITKVCQDHSSYFIYFQPNI